jgi:hypothetical protein
VLGDVCGGSNSPARYALWCAWVYLIGVDTIHVDLFNNGNTDVLVLQFPSPGLRAHVASQSVCIVYVCQSQFGGTYCCVFRIGVLFRMLAVVSCIILAILVCTRWFEVDYFARICYVLRAVQ